jgi:cytochrome c oxidase subunit 3
VTEHAATIAVEASAHAGEHPAHLAHHFNDVEQQRSAAELGMWAFLATEVMFFGGLFLGYTVYRASYPDAFREASRDTIRLLRYLIMTMVMGAAFLGIKAFEYWAEARHGLVPGKFFHYSGPHAEHVELFMTFYFCMTGLHATHMVAGLGLLGTIAWMAQRGRFSAAYNTPVDIAGLYWHFVDLVWIFLFPLLYLIR